MGTRGLTGFVVENQVKASYQQYDSYPDGVGVDALAFARSIADGLPDSMVNLRRSLARIKPVAETDAPDEHQQSVLRAAGYEPSGVSTGSDWYSWLREDQGQMGRLSQAPFILDSANFGNDSLFCEWAYLLNTDDQTLEVYKGFQQEGHTGGRWSDAPGDRGYYGIRLVKTYRLASLPTDREFIIDLTTLDADQ